MHAVTIDIPVNDHVIICGGDVRELRRERVVGGVNKKGRICVPFLTQTVKNSAYCVTTSFLVTIPVAEFARMK